MRQAVTVVGSDMDWGLPWMEVKKGKTKVANFDRLIPQYNKLNFYGPARSPGRRANNSYDQSKMIQLQIRTLGLLRRF